MSLFSGSLASCRWYECLFQQGFSHLADGTKSLSTGSLAGHAAGSFRENGREGSGRATEVPRGGPETAHSTVLAAKLRESAKI